MKYLIIIFICISTSAFATTDTIVEQSEGIKTTTIIFENDTLVHTDSTDQIIHQVVIEKIIEKTNDIVDAYKKKDYGKVLSHILIALFIGYSIYLRRKQRKCKEKN